MSTTLDCAWLLADPGAEAARADVRIAIDGEHIGALTTLDAPVPGRRQLALPALSNAHDHARTFRSATIGSQGRPLESWLPSRACCQASTPTCARRPPSPARCAMASPT